MQYLLQDYNIGKNLLKLRKLSGLTQAEVVNQLQLLGSSMSRDTYAKIETGKRNIKVSDVIALKKVFNTTYDALFEGIDNK
jgi:transcriptional regulator with XRE-family HTH domain